MTPEELAQFIYDYGNLAAAKFRKRYPDLIARRQKLMDEGDLSNHHGTLDLLIELAGEVLTKEAA